MGGVGGGGGGGSISVEMTCSCLFGFLPQIGMCCLVVVGNLVLSPPISFPHFDSFSPSLSPSLYGGFMHVNIQHIFSSKNVHCFGEFSLFLVAHGIICSNCGKRRTHNEATATQEYCPSGPLSQDATWEFFRKPIINVTRFCWTTYWSREKKNRKDEIHHLAFMIWGKNYSVFLVHNLSILKWENL